MTAAQQQLTETAHREVGLLFRHLSRLRGRVRTYRRIRVIVFAYIDAWTSWREQESIARELHQRLIASEAELWAKLGPLHEKALWMWEAGAHAPGDSRRYQGVKTKNATAN